jgi:hypothetical protein
MIYSVRRRAADKRGAQNRIDNLASDPRHRERATSGRQCVFVCWRPELARLGPCHATPRQHWELINGAGDGNSDGHVDDDDEPNELNQQEA